MHRRFHKASLAGLFLLALCRCAVAQPAAPADMISDFRVQHGETRVKIDATLNRIAREQAAAMAAKDALDHSVLGSFSSRAAAAGSERAAENIAYGYDSFPKTLDQWIASSEHRRNLLMRGAERVGVASARSATTGRTYWAMEIAAGYEKPKRGGTKSKLKSTVVATQEKKQASAPQACRLKIMSLCL
jgi:hypothetical protein